MKIEAGKWYRTRTGDKAFIGYINHSRLENPAVGYVGGCPEVECWAISGRYIDLDHPLDLIAEWGEPEPLDDLLPLISEVVVNKQTGTHCLVTSCSPGNGYIVLQFESSVQAMNAKALMDHYTYPDGSPICKEVPRD